MNMRSNWWRRPLRPAGGLVLSVLAVAGCDRGPAAEAPAPPPAVGVAKPVVRDIVEQDEYTGRLGAVESVDVRARVGGYVDAVKFTDGQVVAKGDLLFVIDPRPYVAALQVVEGEAREAQSRLDIAQDDFRRAEGLITTKAISQEEFARRAKTAEAAVSGLATAKARSERARLDVEFTEVRAPMAGRIGRHLVSVGNLVAGGSADSTLLTTIVSTGPIYAYFDIDEQAYVKYLRATANPGSKVFKSASAVEMAILGEEGFSRTGELNFVDNQIDQATGTLRARAVFKNDGLSLSPGVFAKVRLAGSGSQTAVLIPDRSVQADQSDRFVFVVGQDNVVKQKRVTLGRLFNGLRVVSSGLDGTESVVVDGVQRARPGAPVTPELTKLAWKEPAANVAAGNTGGPAVAVDMASNGGAVR